MSFISIIGSGGMAAAIGGLAAKVGHTVEVTSSGAAKARALAEQTGAGTTTGTFGNFQHGQRVDCLVIGGGPAGLTAALYLARFRMTVLVVDRGAGRATSIPLTRNYPGFPDGITGRDLVRRIEQQAVRHGAKIATAEVAALERSGDIFRCRTGIGLIEASAVILATGTRILERQQ